MNISAILIYGSPPRDTCDVGLLMQAEEMRAQRNVGR